MGGHGVPPLRIRIPGKQMAGVKYHFRHSLFDLSLARVSNLDTRQRNQFGNPGGSIADTNLDHLNVSCSLS